MESGPSVEELERQGLLEGLEGEAREARMELLRELLRDGVPLEELREAVEAGRLALLPVERALQSGGRRYTAREVAELAGVDVDLLIRTRMALGVPEDDLDAPTLTDEDLEAARSLAMFLQAGLPEDGLMQVARTIGIATAQIAQSNRELIIRSLIGQEDSEAEVARRLAFAASSLMPLMGPVLTYGLRIHMLSQVSQDVIEAAGLPGAGIATGAEMSVAFADVVGFTRLGERLDLDELGGLADRLGEMASEVSGGPVRLVKQIGDAVMLVSTQPAALVEAALELSELASEDPGYPGFRIGVDHGRLVARAGDFYGPAVNRASRITAIARPDSVLAGGDLRDVLDDEAFAYSFAGERSLKGVSGRVRLFRIRRRSP